MKKKFVTRFILLHRAKMMMGQKICLLRRMRRSNFDANGDSP